jgi:hypothetical protein
LRRLRKEQREAKLQRLVQWRIEEPTSFVILFTTVKYLLDTALIIITINIFHVLLKLFLSINAPFITFSSNYVFFTTSAIFCIGYLLFYFKEKCKYYYGLIELSFAFALIYTAITKVTSLTNSELYPIIITAIYVIVRGLDNMKQGSQNKLFNNFNMSSKTK